MTPETLKPLRESADAAFAAKPLFKPKTNPFSLRLTDEERADLRARAGSIPLGSYIKSELFTDRPKARRKSVGAVVDQKSIAKALALLGQSRLSSNLNQIAKEANIGTLPLTPDVEADVQQACVHVAEIRAALIDALGLKTGGRA